MTSERSMIKIRWLALASALAFFAIMNVAQLRGLLVLVAVGVVYNLLLSSVHGADVPEKLKGLSTFVDLTGLALIIYFTGGANSVFVLFLAIYLFAVAVRHGVGVGLATALLSCAALSYYYFSDPSSATQSLVLTRAVLFVLAPLGAFLLRTPHHADSPRPVDPIIQTVPVTLPDPVETIAPAPQAVVEVPAPVVVAPPVIQAPAPEPAPVIEPPAPPEVKAPVVEAPVAHGPVARPAASHPLKEDKPAKIATERGSLADEVAKAGESSTYMPAYEARALKEKVTELAILHEASKTLGATLVLEEVVDAIVDITAKGLLADIAGALIYDDKTGLMTVAGLRGFTAEEREVINSTAFAPGEGILGEAFSKKKTFNVSDLSAERPGSSPFNGRIKSFLVTPLATDGFDVGVLFLGKYMREPFSLSSEEFLETMAGQAAIAVENARLYTQAQELAIHDGLTGIYNYRYLMKQLEEEIKRAERYGRSLSVAMIDVDLFKHVNDTHGHQRGDDVLRGLVQTLTTNTRETDIVARYGGEEFAVVLPETDLADALDVAEKLREAVAKASYAREKGSSIKITISLGVATYPALASNQEDLLRRADDALYAAKTKRNVVVSAGSDKSTLS